MALPRVGSILEVRRERIAHDLDQAAKMKGEADAAVAAYEQELAEARAKANAIGQDARDAAKAEAEAKRKQVEAELEGSSRRPRRRSPGSSRRRWPRSSTIATDTAAAIVERLIGQQGRQGDGRRGREVGSE